MSLFNLYFLTKLYTYTPSKLKKWILGGTQYITSIGLFYKNVGRFWRVSDCEELVVHLVEYLTRLLGLDYFWMCFVRIPDRTSIHLRLAKEFQSNLGSFR